MQTDAFDTFEFLAGAMQDDVYGLQFSSLTSAAQYEPVYEKTLEYLSPGMTALDWGASRGHFSYFLLGQGLAVTGYSFESAPDFLMTRAGFSFAAGSSSDPVNLPFKDAAFDRVFSIGVLEHVHETGGNQPSSLAEIYRVLKPDGMFLCFHLPQNTGWVEPVKKLFDRNAHFHSRRYSMGSAKRMFEKADFQVVDSGSYNFLPRNEISKVLRNSADSVSTAKRVGSMDRLLASVMPKLTTNLYLIAKKPSSLDS